MALAKVKETVQLPPTAPLPDRVLEAKTVMVTSVADKIVYDEAYRRIHEWGRFQLVGDPERADLILIIRSGYGLRPTRLRDVVLFPVPPAPYYEQDIGLIFLDPATQVEVWTDRQVARPALKLRNREKETILAVDALIQRLRERIPAR